MYPTKGEIKKMLKEADTNKDGQLDFEEFTSIFIKRKGTVDEKGTLREAFKELDTDNSGFLDRKELEAMFQPGEIDVILKDFDKDGDGRIDYDEFLDWLA
ncbi:calmodulin-like [Pecten maximus]|uniref:calmodulin-like n=1 Tax=Pecten maximus TaxID=6579 RepID=UPI0014581903|nr:calmodulin-like [Pecten maximus]